MDKKAETHERILASASRSLRRNGFRVLSVGETMKNAGLTHGGFYAHFSSQEALAAEVLERAGNDGNCLLTKALEGASDPFRALIDVYLSETHLVAEEGGCAVAALASELPHLPASVRDEAVRRVEALTALVARFAPRAVDSRLAAATMVGALQLARVYGPGETARLLLDSARAELLSRAARGM